VSCSGRTSVCARGLPHVLSEGATERGFRLIADAPGDFAEAQVLCSHELRRGFQARSTQIDERRLPKDFANRRASVDRDIPTSRASVATVHGRSGCL
jgi:hypothetical protein